MRLCRREDRARWSALPLCLSFALLAGGCQATPEDVVRWKGTEKGPGKLRTLLHNPEQPQELRAQSALALIDIRRGDEVEAELRGLPEGGRRALVHQVIPPLVDLLHKGPPEGTPTRSQIEAKDALFRLRTLGEPQDRTLADETLIAWTTTDLIGRMSAGVYPSERIITEIGNRAQGALVALLARATIDAPNLLPAASLLGRVGDREAKGHGAELLIKLLQPVLSGGAPSGVVPPQRQIDEVLRALGLLGGPAAGKFLSDLAERGPVTQRGQALAALRETGDPTALELALRIAWDKKEPGSVREAAFAYLEKVGQIAAPGLCRIVADPRDPSDKGDVVRFRALEAALIAGGAEALAPALEALPTERAYDREDFVAYVVHQITPHAAAFRQELHKVLRHKSWVARAAALLALGEMGSREDEPVVQALVGDAAPLRGKGWPATVGDLAKEQAERLRSKK